MTSTADPGAALVERLARRDRRLAAGALLLVTLLAWAWMFAGAGMEDMSGMDMSMPMPWSPGYATLMFFMWWIMMVAMMLPAAAPMILLFALVERRNASAGARGLSGTTVFALGYLLVWGAFSLAATGAHWALDQSGFLSADMASRSRLLGGVLLLTAGAWQFTPWKHACLRHCRGPLDFVMRYWRPGPGGALQMGLRHGAYCVGCCWMMMGLLFYGGVMNLYWIAGIALLVLLEKLAPAGERVGWISGVVLLGWGVWVLI